MGPSSRNKPDYSMPQELIDKFNLLDKKIDLLHKSIDATKKTDEINREIEGIRAEFEVLVKSHPILKGSSHPVPRLCLQVKLNVKQIKDISDKIKQLNQPTDENQDENQLVEMMQKLSISEPEEKQPVKSASTPITSNSTAILHSIMPLNIKKRTEPAVVFEINKTTTIEPIFKKKILSIKPLAVADNVPRKRMKN
ncbi:MAG: hypothetical protein ABI597_03175 [Gammaproteobacteria bacterium]